MLLAGKDATLNGDMLLLYVVSMNTNGREANILDEYAVKSSGLLPQ